MTDTTRRFALGAAVAAGLAPTVAEAHICPPALSSSGDVFRFRVGGFTVTQVHDGHGRRAVEGLVLNASADDVRAVLAESMLPTDHYLGPYTVTFLQTADKLVMFDTGTGAQMTPTSGRLAGNMRAAGIDPGAVDMVVISHCHQDHIHGLTTVDGRAVFERAEILLPELEWAWWSDATNEGRSPAGQRVNFANFARRFAPYAGRTKRYGDGAELLPGVRAMAAYGHSPGHTVYQISDGGAAFMLLADITHRPEVFARRPDYTSAFDFDGAAAVVSRRRVLDMVATDRVLVAGYHFPFPATGHIAREGSGFRFHPADWTALRAS
ncbi:MAG: fold metallo-hydrolase [Rhodospirillales bacterium]|jgi:glyoxylase-like metal-dependent hydrolase (beta-lactamase superfamily II)|nr:fold metallo-hydrolase [Rhodospirillales bacterium]